MTPAALYLLVGIEVFGGGGPLASESGWNAQAGLGVRVVLPVTLFAQVHHSHVSVGGAVPRTDKTTALLAGARLGLFPGPLTPYILGAYGRGFYSNSRRDEDDGQSLHLGGGLQLMITPSARLFAEGRFTVTENEHADGADLGLPLAVGLVWRP
jgi:hypothetical protein